MLGKDEPSFLTVNIGPLLNFATSTREDREAAASKILRACETHGLFFVTGHNISPAQRRVAFDNAKRFFSLPEKVKRKIPVKGGGFVRGYVGFGSESGSYRLECKEGFSYGYPWPADSLPQNELQGPNTWPEEDEVGEPWREGMLDLFRMMVAVSTAISKALSIALGLEKGQDLETLCRDGETISVMRLFHYFPYNEAKTTKDQQVPTDGGTGAGDATKDIESETSKPVVEKTWSSPHTDWGFSTCILQDNVGGLQFLEENNHRWVDVPCSPEDALVVNCGDYLSLFTKGRLKSPVHRVVSHGGKERTSFVFFYYPSFDAMLPADPPAANTTADTDRDNEESKANEDRVSTGDTGATGSGGGEIGGTAVGYNTLLDLRTRKDHQISRINTESFGEYLARKWSDVSRD